MASFRAALSRLAMLNVTGIHKNYDLDELPNSLGRGQLPALLVLPIELERERLFQPREEGLGTAAFSGAAKSVNYRVTHLLLVAPTEAGLGIRSYLPRLIELIDSYTAAIAADITLADTLLVPARVNVEPGSFTYGDRDFYGCAFRHAWLLAT